MASVSRGMGPSYRDGGVSPVRLVEVNRDELGWVRHGSVEVARAGARTACREIETLARIRVSVGRETVDRLGRRGAGNRLDSREKGEGGGGARLHEREEETQI
jgi:hypothetical protein